MRRQTIGSSAHSARMGSSSRSTTRKVDHSTIFPSADLDAGRNDSPKGVPIVQPYGFAYWPAKQDEEDQKQQGGKQGSTSGGSGPSDMAGPGAFGEDDQPKGKSAIGLTSYANGSRSDPSLQNLQDPRHQLMLEDPKEDKKGGQGQGGQGGQQGGGKKYGGKEGDTALYRTNDPKKLQQLHLTDEGPRLSSIQTQKFQLVDEEQDQQSPQQQADGGGGQGGQGGQQKKKEGQNAIFKRPSDTYFEQTKQKTTTKRGSGHVTVEDNDIKTFYESDKKSTRVNNEHVHIRFEDYRIWVNKDGCWTTKPIMIKDDPDAGGSSLFATGIEPKGGPPAYDWDEAANIWIYNTKMQFNFDCVFNGKGHFKFDYLTLHADPILPLHAVTKQYVDNSTTGLASKVDRTGDTMTGWLTMPAGNPWMAQQVATKNYVDSQIDEVGLSDAPFDANTWGRSAAQWVIVPQDTPLDGKYYVRKDRTWVETEPPPDPPPVPLMQVIEQLQAQVQELTSRIAVLEAR